MSKYKSNAKHFRLVGKFRQKYSTFYCQSKCVSFVSVYTFFYGYFDYPLKRKNTCRINSFICSDNNCNQRIE